VADAAQYDHTLTIRDGNTLTEYPWKLSMPFPLSLTDDQVAGIMQVIAAALPPNEYGWTVMASVTGTTTTTTVNDHPYPEVDVPPTPPSP
jgi:hypothetical protein